MPHTPASRPHIVGSTYTPEIQTTWAVGDETWSAIQITTAAGICAVIDMHVAGKLPSEGFVRQEQVNFRDFIDNRFGKHYEENTQPRFHDSED